MHVDLEPATFFVKLHCEVGGFFVQGTAPVDPASAKPIFLDGLFEVSQEGVGEIFPEPNHRLAAALCFKKLE